MKNTAQPSSQHTGYITATGPACAACKKQPSPDCPNLYCGFREKKTVEPTGPVSGKDGVTDA